ncbi:MAG TPA: autotransporter-associated beta strand repeat-containing protein [Phycisphaerae bacterium]|nr:autotransporter-associated beta strand repeat-containing protein [Phycisphaerae bacterium]
MNTTRSSRRHNRRRHFLEALEGRILFAVHEWTGLGANSLWTTSGNWTNGSPATDASGDIDLVFHSNLSSPQRLVMQNDIVGLAVDSITFDASSGTNATGGTSTQGYTINGNGIIINTGAAGQNPFGIDVTTGVADPTNGVTETFNIAFTLAGNDATFRIQDSRAVLAFNSSVDIGGQTLTLNVASSAGNDATARLKFSSTVSNGNIIKTSNGSVQLAGNNSFTNLTVNGGFVYADTNTALGATTGIITVNDPGQVELRNGVTVQKTSFILNSNSTGGGLGAQGNKTSTFIGPVTLQSGNGGVALGAGLSSEPNTRLVIDGVVGGATSTLFFNGPGTVEFLHDNTFTGQANINGNQGSTTILLDTPGGLGATGGGNETVISSGGSVDLKFDGTFADDVQMAGAGVGALGALRVLTTHAVIDSGNITFIAGAPWRIGVDASATLTTTGVISSQGANRALTKAGAGTLIIAGTSANTWQGGATVLAGTLKVTNTSSTPLGSLAGTTGGVVNIFNDSIVQIDAGFGAPNPFVVGGHATLQGKGTVSGFVAYSSLVIATNGKSATYTDEDGDLVKITLSKGGLADADFTFDFDFAGRQQLQRLNLDATDSGATLVITASPNKGVGNGRANVGYINAASVPLGALSVDGDLGRLDAGTTSSLTAYSLAAFGTLTQASGGNNNINITGALGKLTVLTDIDGASVKAARSIGTVDIKGSFIGGSLRAGADIKSLTVRGSITGIAGTPVIISAFGQTIAPSKGKDVAIGSFTVNGNVLFLNLLAGYDTNLAGANSDASIGTILVKGNWTSSSVLAGTAAGADTFVGTGDDAKVGGRDTASIFSSITSITIKGTATGSATAGDTFGIVAEQIGSAKIGATVFHFDPGERDLADAFAIGASGPGGSGLPNDFFIREITT